MPDHKLLPGMYATVDILTGAPENYVTLPQTAITYNPYGDTVYVVDDKGGPDGASRNACAPAFSPVIARQSPCSRRQRRRNDLTAAIRSPCSKRHARAQHRSVIAGSGIKLALLRRLTPWEGRLIDNSITPHPPPTRRPPFRIDR